MSRRTDKKKLKRMNESAVSQASVTVATVSTVKADDAAPAAETTAPVSQPSAAYDLYIQYQGADYNAEELASQILEKCQPSEKIVDFRDGEEREFRRLLY